MSPRTCLMPSGRFAFVKMRHFTVTLLDTPLVFLIHPKVQRSCVACHGDLSFGVTIWGNLSERPVGYGACSISVVAMLRPWQQELGMQEDWPGILWLPLHFPTRSLGAQSPRRTLRVHSSKPPGSIGTCRNSILPVILRNCYLGSPFSTKIIGSRIK